MVVQILNWGTCQIRTVFWLAGGWQESRTKTRWRRCRELCAKSLEEAYIGEMKRALETCKNKHKCCHQTERQTSWPIAEHAWGQTASPYTRAAKRTGGPQGKYKKWGPTIWMCEGGLGGHLQEMLRFCMLWNVLCGVLKLFFVHDTVHIYLQVAGVLARGLRSSHVSWSLRQQHKTRSKKAGLLLWSLGLR